MMDHLTPADRLASRCVIVGHELTLSAPDILAGYITEERKRYLADQLAELAIALRDGMR